MAKRNRITLKKFFVRGKMPTEEHFSDLIDSMLNIVDEGFEKTPQHGLSMAPLDEEGHVLSIFQKIEEEESKWSIILEKSTGNLVIRRFDGKELLVLSQDGKIGIGEKIPKYQLHSNEMVGLFGRAGTFSSGKVPADSNWHSVTEPLDGCWALEIMAGCGKQQYGKYALLVATAVHCFGAHPRITKTQSYYGSRFNKIMLRWIKVDGKPVLQMKTRYNYGNGIMISYNISSLWDDHRMFGNLNQSSADG